MIISKSSERNQVTRLHILDMWLRSLSKQVLKPRVGWIVEAHWAISAGRNIVMFSAEFQPMIGKGALTPGQFSLVCILSVEAFDSSFILSQSATSLPHVPVSETIVVLPQISMSLPSQTTYANCYQRRNGSHRVKYAYSSSEASHCKSNVLRGVNSKSQGEDLDFQSQA